MNAWGVDQRFGVEWGTGSEGRGRKGQPKEEKVVRGGRERGRKGGIKVGR